MRASMGEKLADGGQIAVGESSPGRIAHGQSGTNAAPIEQGVLAAQGVLRILADRVEGGSTK
jgi:hypothetical protein